MDGQTDQWRTDGLTLLWPHLRDLLEPLPPRLTVTGFMGLTKALPEEEEEEEEEKGGGGRRGGGEDRRGGEERG